MLHLVQTPLWNPKMMYYKYVIQCTFNPQAVPLKMSGMWLFLPKESTSCGVLRHI
jgi:hypothetical protein